ncbi:MAG TPA: hypothetical protein PLU95_06530 [Syntrophales bacterium]|jgi:hypothetical protein|nr:hypothetical protein [Syntrophales bacterium]HOD98196.1 hypothetical protein [Syntrophales bacterium]HOH73664.1 hypothetical protein [Syntrophales bacterium]HPN08940.1 hypothetical protein [Syntrophales bacterium]HPX80588.1 hypothetical protein [Syntrophales bacterium]
MKQQPPKDTTQVIREAFYDLALSLECLFLLYGTSDLFAEDVVRCLEEGYTSAMKRVRKLGGPPGSGKIRRQTAVTRFLSRLEREKSDRELSGGERRCVDEQI